MAADERDLDLRRAAVRRAEALIERYDSIVPRTVLAEGFSYDGRRIPFSSFQKGIHRSAMQRGPAALSLTTSFKDPYRDAYVGGAFSYAYRSGSVDQADNRALQAAHRLQVPVIHFKALAPGVYLTVAPMLVVGDDAQARRVLLEVGSSIDLTPAGIVSSGDLREYRTAQVRRRLHQQRFRLEVMRAYRHSCAVCRLRESELVQAAHITADVEAAGVAAVVNGIALCAIHHLAFDRNILGVDPEAVVHINSRVLKEKDGPMLSMGLQGFHGSRLHLPARVADRPDRERLAARFETFAEAT